MSERQSRWEIVHTASGWHARFRSSNGMVIVSSETYERRRDALNAVAIVGDAPSYSNGRDHELIEVRDIDEIPVPPRDLDDASALGLWAAAQPKVKAEIKADKKIHAIKELRELTGASLLQAKLAVEQIPRWKR